MWLQFYKALVTRYVLPCHKMFLHWIIYSRFRNVRHQNITLLFTPLKRLEESRVVYAIPKINMLCNLHCLEARLRLLCNKYQQHSSLNGSFHNSLSYVTYLFSEWRIKEQIIGIAMVSKRDFDNVNCDWRCNIYAL